MLRIRLQRVGRNHEPSFRLVLTDSQNSSKSGRFKEILGSYDPRKSTESFDTERIQYWLSVGASPTDTVNNLLIKKGIIRGKKVAVHALSKKKAKETKEEAPADASGEATSDASAKESTPASEEVATPEPASTAEEIAPAPVAEEPASVEETPDEKTPEKPTKPAE